MIISSSSIVVIIIIIIIITIIIIIMDGTQTSSVFMIVYKRLFKHYLSKVY